MALIGEKTAALWGKWGISVTIMCTIVGFISGGLYTKWVSFDIQQGYLKQILFNAISELDYNSSIAWYIGDKYIKTTLYFPSLRTDALWDVYYNRNQVFGDDPATVDKILECLNEIDWVNRQVLAQYGADVTAIWVPSPETEITSEMLAKARQDPASTAIIGLHKAMVSRYNSRVKPLMSQVSSYMKTRLKDF